VAETASADFGPAVPAGAIQRSYRCSEPTVTLAVISRPTRDRTGGTGIRYHMINSDSKISESISETVLSLLPRARLGVRSRLSSA
jgi:hypothetical protein